MVNIIRRFQQPLMLTITVLVIVSFIWLFNKNNVTDRYAAITTATIYGQPVSMNRLKRGVSFFQLAEELRLQDLVAGLIGREMMIGAMFGQVSQQRVAQEFSFNEYILQHEAETLGLKPTTDDISQVVQQIPQFQTNGAFDLTKFNQFAALALPPLGLTEGQFEELIGDQLRLRMLKELVGNSIQPTAAEIRTSYEERSRKMDVSLVRLKLEDFKAAIQITDDDVKKLFEERKATLKTPEKRRVKFVTFALDAAKPPTGAERAETLQKLADTAGAFSAAMTEKNASFDDLAAKDGVKVQTSEDFTETLAPTGLDEKSAEAAFSLTKEQPNSDAVLLAKNDGYAVLQLVDITPSRPLTLEEAKTQLTEQLKQDRAQEAMNLKATEIRNKIDADLKAGKSFTEAAEAAGVKAEKFPTFSRADRQASKEPDANAIVSAAGDLREGQLSSFLPTDTGGLILHMDKLLPIDEADFEKEKPTLAKNLAAQQSEAIFDSWFKQQKKVANIH